MSNRITQKDLELLVNELNEAQGFVPENVQYNTVGAYKLDYAYGGVKLVKIVSAGGGQTNVSSGGYGTKRELYTFLRGLTYQIK
jgi:hypothetical protein